MGTALVLAGVLLQVRLADVNAADGLCAVTRQSVGPSEEATAPNVQSHVMLQRGIRSQAMGIPGEVAALNAGTVGFYIPVFPEDCTAPGKLLRVVREARHFYPESPIHLSADGGALDFSGVCQLSKYNCSFEWAPEANSRWNPHPFLQRFRRAAERFLSTTSFIIYLEPDMQVLRRHRVQPEHDAGGANDTDSPPLQDATAAYLERRGQEVNSLFQLRLEGQRLGLTGGSYFRTQSLLDAFDPSHVAHIDFQRLHAQEGERAFRYDFIMHVAFSLRGYMVRPWTEVLACPSPSALQEEGRRYNFSFPEAAFQLRGSCSEGEDIFLVEQNERWLLRELPKAAPVTCRGCVWYSDSIPLPKQSLPIGMGLAEAVGRHSAEREAHDLPLIFPSKRPAWLLRGDELVVDLNPSEGGNQSDSRVLILQTVLMDARGSWGTTARERPRWLRACLAANRHHAMRYGHAMALRWRPSEPQLTAWQTRDCQQRNQTEAVCREQNERENFNWEKHLALAEYLESPLTERFTHILVLDADAALVKPDHDTLGEMATSLRKLGKDVFLSDEDWLVYGQGRINGGMLFTARTPFARRLFRDTFHAHELGPEGGNRRWDIGVKDQQCTSNEQICLNDLWHGSEANHITNHVIVASGRRYNRGACVLHECGDSGGASDQQMKASGIGDPELDILHFMGPSKDLAAEVLCGEGERDLTGGGPNGYGCRP